MGYQAYLQRMLQPLGVYREGGYNGGELAALGDGLDRAEEALEKCLDSFFPSGVESSGIGRVLELFPMLPNLEREAAVAAAENLWKLDNRSFSKDHIQKALANCGIEASFGELGEFQILVVLQEPMTIDKDPVYYFWLMEQILPCHLLATVRYDYTDIETGKETQERLPLGDLRKRSQSQWERMLGAYA